MVVVNFSKGRRDELRDQGDTGTNCPPHPSSYFIYNSKATNANPPTQCEKIPKHVDRPRQSSDEYG